MVVRSGVLFLNLETYKRGNVVLCETTKRPISRTICQSTVYLQRKESEINKYSKPKATLAT